jgi:hypothetical protein
MNEQQGQQDQEITTSDFPNLDDEQLITELESSIKIVIDQVAPDESITKAATLYYFGELVREIKRRLE